MPGRLVQAAGTLAGQHDDRAVQPHLDLQVALRSAVIGARSRRRGGERVGHRAAGGRFLRQQTRLRRPSRSR